LEWSVRDWGELPLFIFFPFQQYPISFFNQCSFRSPLVRVSALNLLRVVYCVSGGFLQTQKILHLIFGVRVIDWLMPGGASWMITIIQVKPSLTGVVRELF
jgi:hypothetical protein